MLHHPNQDPKLRSKLARAAQPSHDDHEYGELEGPSLCEPPTDAGRSQLQCSTPGSARRRVDGQEVEILPSGQQVHCHRAGGLAAEAQPKLAWKRAPPRCKTSSSSSSTPPQPPRPPEPTPSPSALCAHPPPRAIAHLWPPRRRSEAAPTPLEASCRHHSAPPRWAPPRQLPRFLPVQLSSWTPWGGLRRSNAPSRRARIFSPGGLQKSALGRTKDRSRTTENPVRAGHKGAGHRARAAARVGEPGCVMATIAAIGLLMGR
eukprot:SAG22_NODE_292_length_12914_cov_41.306594_3_plen_261_part_00